MGNQHKQNPNAKVGMDGKPKHPKMQPIKGLLIPYGGGLPKDRIGEGCYRHRNIHGR